MKPKIIFLCLIGIVCTALLYFLRPDKNQQSIHPTADAPIVPKNKNRSDDQQPLIRPTVQSIDVSDSVAPNASTESAEAVWLSERSAGITVNQTQQGKLQYPGSINVGGVVVDLGETPPLIHYQLKAKGGSLLVGELDDRHSFQRYLGMVQVTAGRPQVSYEVSYSHTRSASAGGFVFKRDETEISQLGIIIPEIRVPVGDDPSSSQWAMSIRIGSRELNAEDLAKAMLQPMGSDTVLVMPTHPGPPPETARVLWLVLDANGSFVVLRN